MARKTQAERIEELERAIATLHERVNNLDRQGETNAGFALKLVVIEERLNEMKRLTDEASRKWWSLLPPVLGAVVGAVLALLVQRLLQLWR